MVAIVIIIPEWVCSWRKPSCSRWWGAPRSTWRLMQSSFGHGTLNPRSSLAILYLDGGWIEHRSGNELTGRKDSAVHIACFLIARARGWRTGNGKVQNHMVAWGRDQQCDAIIITVALSVDSRGLCCQHMDLESDCPMRKQLNPVESTKAATLIIM